MDKLQSDIVEQLASKYNKPEHVVEKVIRSQFKLVLDIMQEQKYEMIKAQKRKLLDAAGFGVDVFSGTEPIEEAADPSNGQAGALSGVEPNDAGVDIAGIMAVANRDWSKMI